MGLREEAYGTHLKTEVVSESESLYIPKKERLKQIKTLEREMREAARLLEYEHAASIRDQIKRLNEMEILEER